MRRQSIARPAKSRARRNAPKEKEKRVDRKRTRVRRFPACRVWARESRSKRQWRVVASRARLFRARASRTILASAYLSCSPMRFQSASSWSFSYEVCRRPRANAPRVPRRRSDFPPASCGASARTSARREAHRRVASPPAPMAIPERSPRSPRGSVSVSPPPRGCLWHGQPRHRGATVFASGRDDFVQAGPFDGQRFAIRRRRKKEFAREFLF